jgi:hypothetical protein
MGEVPQSRATGADGLGEHFFDGLCQPGIPLPRNPARSPARGDTGTEQGLDGVDVADPHYDPLIHQEGLDAGGSLPAALEEIISSEFIREWFGA